MFAKGFVTTPALSWENNTSQLIWAWVTGALGLLALGWLIYQAVGVLRPTLFELGNLPPGYKDLINKEPRFYLPTDAPSFDEFLANLDSLRTEEGKSRIVLETRQGQLQEAQEDTPPDQAKTNTAKAELKKATAQHNSLMRNLTVYNRARNNLLGRASYWKASQGLDVSAWSMALAAVLAAAGGIGYQLLLAAPAVPDASKVAATTTVGELVRSDTAAGKQLWQQLHLARCQADPASTRIAVVVGSGNGTDADPYVVSTIPTERCVAATFTVVNDVAQVSVPPKTVITYIPAPQATSSPK
jgi:hypothetical protein